MKKFLLGLVLIPVLLIILLLSKSTSSVSAAPGACSQIAKVPLELIGQTTNGDQTTVFKIRVKWSTIADQMDDVGSPYTDTYLRGWEGNDPRSGQIGIDPLSNGVPTDQDVDVIINRLPTGTHNIEIYAMLSSCTFSDPIKVTVTFDEAKQDEPIAPGMPCETFQGARQCVAGSRCEEKNPGSGSYECTCQKFSETDPDNACPADRSYCNQQRSGSNFYFCGAQATRADQIPTSGIELWFSLSPDPNDTSKILGTGQDVSDPNNPGKKTTYKVTPNEKLNRKVYLHGSGLTRDEYWICGRPNDEGCSDKEDAFIKAKVNSDPSSDNYGTFIAPIELCGNGENALKGSQPGTSETVCDDTRDYFHGGHTYRLSLMSDVDWKTALVPNLKFYVTRYYPSVRIGNTLVVQSDEARGVNPIHILTPSDDTSSDGPKRTDGYKGTPASVIENSIRVSIDSKRPNESRRNRNNYQAVLQHINQALKQEECFSPVPDGNKKTFASFGKRSDDGQELIPGRYILKINEEINEGNALVFWDWNTCDGGMTYYDIYLTVKKGPEGSMFLTVDKIVTDPNGVDHPESQEDYLFKNTICADGKVDPETGGCVEVRSALGNISVKPIQFIADLFNIVLVIAAVSTLSFIIYAGYLIMMSRGDKEKIAKAREIVTSAVVGMIFIVISFSVLAIIGVDILRIPGFSR